MYIYMNTCVCTYIDVPSSSSWGDMLETGNPDTPLEKLMYLLSFSPALTSCL